METNHAMDDYKDSRYFQRGWHLFSKLILIKTFRSFFICKILEVAKEAAHFFTGRVYTFIKNWNEFMNTGSYKLIFIYSSLVQKLKL